MFSILVSDKVSRSVSQEKRTGHESYFMKSLKDSRRPESTVTSEMAMVSPPGIIKASHRDSCCFIRIVWVSHTLILVVVSKTSSKPPTTCKLPVTNAATFSPPLLRPAIARTAATASSIVRTT